MLVNNSTTWILLLVSFTFFSCSNTKINTTDIKETDEQELIAESIPKVDFSEIEKILSIQDDTLRVFNFWATWCKPCVEELPILEELSQKNKGKLFAMYYISLDFPKQIESKLVPFLKENPLNGKVIVLDDPDSNSWIDKVNPNWSGAIPATIITKGDKNGFHEGQLNSIEDIQKLVKGVASSNS